MTDFKTSSAPGNTAPSLKEQEKAIIEAVRSLKYGSVEIVIHEGRIMEVTKKQRVRFKGSESEAGEKA